MVRTFALLFCLAPAVSLAQEGPTTGDVTAASSMNMAEREAYVDEAIAEMEDAVAELVELLVEARMSAENEDDKNLKCVTYSLFAVRGLLEQVKSSDINPASSADMTSSAAADGAFRRVVVARLAATEKLMKARECVASGAVSGGETEVRWSSSSEWSTQDGTSDSSLDVTEFGGDSPGASPFS